MCSTLCCMFATFCQLGFLYPGCCDPLKAKGNSHGVATSYTNLRILPSTPWPSLECTHIKHTFINITDPTVSIPASPVGYAWVRRSTFQRGTNPLGWP